jgi:hypothetical protein
VGEDALMTACQDCKDLPRAVDSWLPLTGPGVPLVIFEGEMRRSAGTGEVTAPGRISLAWKRRPRLVWSVDLDGVTGSEYVAWQHRPGQGMERLALDLEDMPRAEVDVQVAGSGNGWLKGDAVGDEDAPLDHVVAHWINLPMIRPATTSLHDHRGDAWRTWDGRWQMVMDGWTVTIDARPDHSGVYREAAEAESFVITHVMDLRRSDDSTFTGAEATEALTVLQYAFSFAVGHWTCPAVPVGFGPDGEVRWSDWRPLYADPPRRGAGWWADTRSDDLANFVKAFFTHWSDAAKCEPLKFAVTSAILSVDSGFLEQRLLTAAAALEMLSWVTDVLEGGMDEGKWRSKGSAWRIRRLLTGASVDVALRGTNEMDALARFAKAEQLQDAPGAFALVRDRVTHPKDTRDLYRFEGLVAQASWLACRYLELAVLYRIGYGGHAADRTILNRSIWDSEPVPWTKNVTTPRP